MELDFSLTASTGMAGGMVYQFAEGRWREGLGPGLVMSESAYDFLEPILDRACPGASGPARYGVAELDPEMCRSLAVHLRQSAEHVRSLPAPEEIEINAVAVRTEEVCNAFEHHRRYYAELSNLFSRLADWLEDASKRSSVVSLLGL